MANRVVEFFRSSDSESSDDSDAEQSPNDAAATETFADDVRSNYPEDDDIRAEGRYTDPDGTGAADDTDPRKLFRQPTINEIRYYAREGPYGPTIVRKPIADAFKHGFEVVGDNTAGEDGEGVVGDFLREEYLPVYKKAKVRARRDGLCVVMAHFQDAAESVAEPPADDATFDGFQMWTIDNLSDSLGEAMAARHVEYEATQLYVTEGRENGGVVMVDDVGHPDHGTIVGDGIEPRRESENEKIVQFVHADRCQHLTEREYVDGELGNAVYGEIVGSSVLTPVLQPLKAAQMGFWSLKEILHRYSAPLHAIEPPESWNTEDFETAQERLGAISMSSDAVLPPGSELEVAEGVSEFDPEPYYDVLVEAICAGTIFTTSVLQGTQSGTVSGSETDLKGYFNGVHNLREQDVDADFREILRLVSRHDQSTIPRVADIEGLTFEWGGPDPCEQSARRRRRDRDG